MDDELSSLRSQLAELTAEREQADAVFSEKIEIAPRHDLSPDARKKVRDLIGERFVDYGAPARQARAPSPTGICRANFHLAESNAIR